MPNEALTSKAPSDQEMFNARLKRYAKEQALCVTGVVIFVMLGLLHGDGIVFSVFGVSALIFRLVYLQVQKNKLIARGRAKSKQDWWDEWDERKKS